MVLSNLQVPSSENTPLAASRQPYHKPVLQELGDLRTFTLGGTPGVNDSGTPFVTRPPRKGYIPFLPEEFETPDPYRLP